MEFYPLGLPAGQGCEGSDGSGGRSRTA